MIRILEKAMLVLACLLMGGWQSVSAQKWGGNELSKILATSKDDVDDPSVTDADKANPAKTVFLYNVAKGKFLYQGESSGTHTIYSEIGIRCWVVKHQETVDGEIVDKYYIETACDNNQLANSRGNWLGNDENDRGPFVDMSPKLWEIEPVEAGSTKYYIHNLDESNVDCYLYASNADRNVNRDKDKDHVDLNLAEWVFVTEQELLNEFNKTSIELGGVPADATFLLGNPDFHRFSTELNRWNWTKKNGAVLRVGIDNHYQAFKQSGACSEELGEWNSQDVQAGKDVPNGKYWCAKINGGTGTLSQTVKINKTGWYRVLCQGECYLKDAKSNNNAFLFAKYKKGDKEVNARQPLRMSSVPIERTSWTAANIKNTEGKNYYDKYGDYTNTVMIYVDCDESNSQTVELELGVDLIDDGLASGLGENDFGVAVDAFRLQYSGKPAGHDLVLDENNKNFDYINNDVLQNEYENAILYLQRSFNLNCWNTIVLPVSLTADQFNTAFGADSKLARYEGVKNNRLQFVVQDDKKAYDTEEKGAFLKANTPYIIWPTVAASHDEVYSYDVYNTESTEKQYTVATSGAYYVVNNVNMTKDAINEVEKTIEDKAGDYVFKGILVKNFEGNSLLDGVSHVKAGDYTFNKGSLHCFKAENGMLGFRAWFTPKSSTESSAKPMGVDINGVQGEVTGLDFVETTQSNAASSAIYDLRGQKMNAKSIDELPRGIYIVNHKKYVVK